MLFLSLLLFLIVEQMGVGARDSAPWRGRPDTKMLKVGGIGGYMSFFLYVSIV